MKVLGIDASTSTVGLAVLEFNGKKVNPLYVNYYKPIKETLEDKNIDFLFTLSATKKHILELIETYQPDYIAIEEYIKFLKGGSAAKTIIPLSLINRTICLSAYESYPNTPLKICNVISIRNQIRRDMEMPEVPPKETLPEIMEKLLKINIPRPMKKTKKGEKLMEEHFDMTDAICVAYYCKRQLDENSRSL